MSNRCPEIPHNSTLFQFLDDYSISRMYKIINREFLYLVTHKEQLSTSSTSLEFSNKQKYSIKFMPSEDSFFPKEATMQQNNYRLKERKNHGS